MPLSSFPKNLDTNQLRPGHVFIDCMRSTDGYLGLICMKNGSLSRNYVRDKYGNGDWMEMEKLIAAVPPGNENFLGYYFLEEEITPKYKY
jgi:hypothetical protein